MTLDDEERDETDDRLDREPCPECGAPLITKWSGMKCPECDYWFCL